MNITLLHLCGDCMNLYGDWGNLALLTRHLTDLGNAVATETEATEESLRRADFIYMGAGTERNQKLAAELLLPLGDTVKALAADGVSMLFAGNSMELLGESVTNPIGQQTAGIRLAEFRTIEGTERIVGDVYGDSPLVSHPIVGFMNKCSRSEGIETPLLTRLALGYGNDAPLGAEGLRIHNVLGTHLTGPVLVKNPRLTLAVIAAIYARRGAALPTDLPDYPYEQQAYDVTLAELRRRANDLHL